MATIIKSIEERHRFFIDYLKKYQRFVKFGMVGFSNTLISLGVYYILIEFNAYYQLANVVAFIFSSLSGFFLNRMWVFKVSHQPLILQIIKYYMVYFASLILGVVLSYVWVELANLSMYIAPLINLVFTIPFNYILSKKWAFRKADVVWASISIISITHYCRS